MNGCLGCFQFGTIRKKKCRSEPSGFGLLFHRCEQAFVLGVYPGVEWWDGDGQGVLRALGRFSRSQQQVKTLLIILLHHLLLCSVSVLFFQSDGD